MISESSLGAQGNEYPANFVKVIDLTIKEKELFVTYTTNLETLYFSPGINIEENNGKVIIHFIRCGINKKCKTDFPSKIEDGKYFSHATLTNQYGRDSIYIGSTPE